MTADIRPSLSPRALSRWILFAAVAVAPFLPLRALAEYRLGVGDVLELSAAGVPDLRQRARVDLDGEVSLPLLGQMKAAGLPLSEFREKVRQLLPTKVLRRKTGASQDIVIIDPEEITLDVVEYRPIYLNGDVSKPGELPFRPGMTVRQAVALAGGYDVMHGTRTTDPVIESANLRSEYEALWTELVKEQARVWRLQAELAGSATLDHKALPQAPIPAQITSQIVQLEAEQLTAREADVKKEKTHLQSAVEQANRQLGFLLEQQRKSQDEIKLAAADLQRTTELFQKNLVPITRLNDERRLALASETRLLDTSSRVVQVNRELEELGRRLQKVDDQRRLDLLRELGDANIKIATARSKLQAVNEKLLYTGTARSELTRGKGRTPEITVFRKGEKGKERFAVDEDADLAPGDTVEINLRSEHSIESALR